MVQKDTLFSGEWSSSCWPLRITFNKNVWHMLPNSYDEEDGVLFGLIDFYDGSSFGFDCAAIDDDEVCDYKFGEDEYFSRLFNSDNAARELDRFNLSISGVDFRCMSYAFNNRKFGQQVIVRGQFISQSFVIGISIASPYSSAHETASILPKFEILLANFQIDKDVIQNNSTVVYDKAKYHLETTEDLDLPEEHACHHTTYFLSWLINNGLMSDEFESEQNNPVNEYRNGCISINKLYEWWDCCLISDMISPEGNAFAQVYFDFNHGEYLDDYVEVLQNDLPSLFHVPYTVENESLIHSVIDKRFNAWKNTQ